jgi:hypothetical protein
MTLNDGGASRRRGLKDLVKAAAALLILILFISAPAVAAETRLDVKPEELKRMSVFLSNFTALGMMDFETAKLSRAELINFGIWHNYGNNYRSRIVPCKREGCPFGGMTVDGKYVAESVKKYFGLKIREHGAVSANGLSYGYDGKLYHFDGADGEAVYHARVKEVYREDSGSLRMTGEVCCAEDELRAPKHGFTALARPWKYGGKNSWAIISFKAARSWFE